MRPQLAYLLRPFPGKDLQADRLGQPVFENVARKVNKDALDGPVLLEGKRCELGGKDQAHRLFSPGILGQGGCTAVAEDEHSKQQKRREPTTPSRGHEDPVLPKPRPS